MTLLSLLPRPRKNPEDRHVPEKLVTVATFTQPLEAQIARGRLEHEGITVFLTGDLTASAFAGFSGIGGLTELQVPEADAERAATVLAECMGEEELDDDWESRAEQEEDLWVCSLCGSSVANDLEVCPSCKTPKEAIRSGTRTSRIRSQAPVADELAEQGVQKREEIATGRPLDQELPEPESDLQLPSMETFLGDDLARRAFRSALVSLAVVPLGLYSLWLLLRLALFSGEVSPVGMRRIYGAILLTGVNVILWLGLIFWVSMVDWERKLAFAFLLLGLTYIAFILSRR
jgi:hypothetical protein